MRVCVEVLRPRPPASGNSYDCAGHGDPRPSGSRPTPGTSFALSTVDAIVHQLADVPGNGGSGPPTATTRTPGVPTGAMSGNSYRCSGSAASASSHASAGPTSSPSGSGAGSRASAAENGGRLRKPDAGAIGCLGTAATQRTEGRSLLARHDRALLAVLLCHRHRLPARRGRPPHR